MVARRRKLNGTASTSESSLGYFRDLETDLSAISVGRGLMKKFTSGADLAKDMGISEEKLKSVFENYNQIAAGKQKDPFGKKFFSVGEWKMDDYFNVVSNDLFVPYRGYFADRPFHLLGLDGTGLALYHGWIRNRCEVSGNKW